MSPSTDLHPFDQAVALELTGPDCFQGQIPQTYANMVGPFGGVIAAVALNSILQHPERQGDPISLTVNFAGPIADAPFAVTARAVRTNRSNQHWCVELTQGEQVAVTATAILAKRQETWSDAELRAPEAPPAESVQSWPVSAGPIWIQRYNLKFIRGILTLSGKPTADSQSLLWVRDEPPRPLDFLSLMAMSDVFFPRVFIRQQKRAPVGTVTITTHFHADAEALARQADRSILAAARGQRFYRNYFDQTAELWSDTGELLASSSQMVYFKD